MRVEFLPDPGPVVRKTEIRPSGRLWWIKDGAVLTVAVVVTQPLRILIPQRLGLGEDVAKGALGAGDLRLESAEVREV